MTDTRTRLIALLMRLAPDLAAKLWAVADVRELSADVRGEIADVLGREAAERGLDRDGNLTIYDDELNALAAALLDE